MDEFKKVSKDVPLAKRPQKWWDLLSILGGVVAAVLWFLYGSVRSGREGFDLITPLLMIGIPIILVWFREDIDRMLDTTPAAPEEDLKDPPDRAWDRHTVSYRMDTLQYF